MCQSKINRSTELKIFESETFNVKTTNYLVHGDISSVFFKLRTEAYTSTFGLLTHILTESLMNQSLTHPSA